MHHHVPRIVILVLALAAPLSALADDEAPRKQLPESVDRFVWWLPADTETLIVSQGPFEVFPHPTEETIDELTFLETARLVPMWPLADVQDGLLWKEFQEQNVVVAVQGGRRFRPLGMLLYEGCHIVQFDEAAHDAVERAFRAGLERADETIRLAGTRVAVFEHKIENDVWSLFVAHPEAGILLAATDRAYLEAVLRRRERKADVRALPDDLPEWEHVDLEAPVWAVRHYRAENAEKDPSSPRAGRATQLVSDPKAVGFVFWYDAGGKTARARYLSESPNALQLATRGWRQPTEHLEPEIAEAAPGVIEISVPVREQETRHSFLYVLLWYLGHGIVV
jgi:hypothetical protein